MGLIFNMHVNKFNRFYNFYQQHVLQALQVQQVLQVFQLLQVQQVGQNQLATLLYVCFYCALWLSALLVQLVAFLLLGVYHQNKHLDLFNCYMFRLSRFVFVFYVNLLIQVSQLLSYVFIVQIHDSFSFQYNSFCNMLE